MPNIILLDTARPGARAFLIMGVIWGVVSIRFLLQPWPPTGTNGFLGTIGAAAAAALLWRGGRRRMIWINHEKGTLTERRELLGARKEVSIPLDTLTGVAVTPRDVVVRKKLGRLLGARGDTVVMHHVELTRSLSPIVLERYRDAAKANERAGEIEKQLKNMS